MRKDRIFSYFLAFCISYLYSYVFFRNFIISLVFGFVISAKSYNIIYSQFLNSKKKLNRLVFRELLDIINSNILSGNNFINSLKFSVNEINNIFSDNNPIIEKLKISISDIENGNSIEKSLLNYKKELKIKEVDIFVDSIIISLESGINISNIVSNSKDMLSENISLELELNQIINNSKKEFFIMAIMPLIILIVLSTTNPRTLNLIDYVIRVPIFVIFLFSIFLGYKIVELEV